MTSDEGPPATGVPSYAQERRILAVCDAPASGPPAKNVPLLCRLPVKADVELFAEAFRTFVRRHPALQYRFAHRDGDVSLRHVGARASDIRCSVIARGDLPAVDDAIAAHVRAEVDRPFDVLGWPLIRAGVIQDDRPLVYVSADHLVVDGWSVLLAMREIEAIYNAVRAGLPTTLPPAGDFLRYSAVERRRYSAGPLLDHEIGLLRRELAGRPAEPAIPIDAGPWDATRGRYVDVDLLDAGDAESLLRQCREAKVTPFMVALAAFAVASLELTGRTETGIMVATHNRDEPSTQDSVGWYANMLPLYVPAPPGSAFGDVVLSVRARLMRLLGAHALPLARVLDSEPAGFYGGVGDRFPGCFMSFVDVRAPAPRSPDGRGSGTREAAPSDRWQQLDLAPSHRMSYGIWVILRGTGLRAVVASPQGADPGRLAAFEARFASVLRDAARTGAVLDRADRPARSA